MVIAVIREDLKTDPLPSGQPLNRLPKCFPSHPKGHSKFIFREPWSRKLADPMHASEKGLPRKAPVAQLEPVQVELTSWNWPRFYTAFSEDNSDILSILFHPHPTLQPFINAMREWRDLQVSTRDKLVNTLLVLEEHAFYIVLLKLVATKGEANKSNLINTARPCCV